MADNTGPSVSTDGNGAGPDLTPDTQEVSPDGNTAGPSIAAEGAGAEGGEPGSAVSPEE
ncbi:hypothetical protein [Streptomyces kasugaensis]|uniref:hypothetical protein n=1 Tax=Streptomyces kasugaensis TaxID=1946 RepID=UPI0013EF7956|nr:hypothetical protein [Streptomyces kasugaensis]